MEPLKPGGCHGNREQQLQLPIRYYHVRASICTYSVSCAHALAASCVSAARQMYLFRTDCPKTSMTCPLHPTGLPGRCCMGMCSFSRRARSLASNLHMSTQTHTHHTHCRTHTHTHHTHCRTHTHTELGMNHALYPIINTLMSSLPFFPLHNLHCCDDSLRLHLHQVDCVREDSPQSIAKADLHNVAQHTRVPNTTMPCLLTVCKWASYQNLLATCLLSCIEVGSLPLPLPSPSLSPSPLTLPLPHTHVSVCHTCTCITTTRIATWFPFRG